jgi:hypothetical protein
MGGTRHRPAVVLDLILVLAMRECGTHCWAEGRKAMPQSDPTPASGADGVRVASPRRLNGPLTSAKPTSRRCLIRALYFRCHAACRWLEDPRPAKNRPCRLGIDGRTEPSVSRSTANGSRTSPLCILKYHGSIFSPVAALEIEGRA